MDFKFYYVTFQKKKRKRIYIQYVYLLLDGKVSRTICCKFYKLELNVINTNTCLVVLY